RTQHEESQEEGESRGGRERPWTMTLPSLACLVLCLCLGAFPSLTDALGLRTPRPDLRSYIYESITLIVVGILVTLALRRSSSSRLVRLLRRPADALRAIHSGTFTDYMAWMVGGAGALALAMWAALGRSQ
ncbi:MAG: hypothetical protein ACRELF_19605, partial [Gemmataceae bacterium]